MNLPIEYLTDTVKLLKKRFSSYTSEHKIQVTGAHKSQTSKQKNFHIYSFLLKVMNICRFIFVTFHPFLL